nr:uncharacterized protein LOC113810775 [Penaeus vannamei]
MEVRRRVMRLSGSLCVLLALMSLRRVCCAPSGGHRASPQTLMTHLKTNLSARLQLVAQGEVKRQPARTEGAGRSGSWLHDLLALLHLLGVSEADLAAFLDALVQDVESVLAQLPPRELMAVEMAAGDILGMLQGGELDLERLQVDLNIIYTLTWPYVNEDLKPTLQLILDLVLWLLGQRDASLPLLRRRP